MDSDKNKNLLEKQLKAVGKKVRVDILKKLSISQVPLSFSTLEKEILGNNSNSTNFSFHLNTLKKNKLIENKEDGYSLSILGRQILRNILSIEKILNTQNKSVMIRTSRYSKEPFDLKKVKEYLIKEGAMEPFQAKQIAQEVEERLSKTTIEYLTAPLMREYINGVLLENGLEEVRHRLTRLGTPPSEVSQYFSTSDLNPELLMKSLGSEISEQYLLLNLLPKNLADLYLSGEIYLLYLDYWSLRPLSIYLDTSHLLDFIAINNDINQNFNMSHNPMGLVLGFLNFLKYIKPFYSEDLLLGKFNALLEYFNKSSLITKKSYKIFLSELFNFNFNYTDKRSHLSLNLTTLISEFLHDLSEIQNNRLFPIVPNLMVTYSCLNHVPEEIYESKMLSNIKFYDSSQSKLLNSTLNYINSPLEKDKFDNQIILDKILINLHTIALESHQNDDAFLDLVQKRVLEVFKFFSIKKELVKKKLQDSKSWNRLVSTFFNHDNQSWIDKSIKSISYYGLNNAIRLHCGIEMDRIDRSEKFALEVLTLIRDIISEKASDDNETYLLNQPHEGAYLYQTNKNSHNYSMELIRKESKLSLDQKLGLFKKFELLMDGGSLFNYYISPNQTSLRGDIKKIISSKIPAFSIRFK